MKFFKRWIILLILSFFTMMLLLFPEVSQAAIARGLKICSKSILPALFPFFAVSNLWINLGICQKLSKHLSSVTVRLFHVPGEAANPLVLGAIGGYPVGAFTTADQYTRRLLSKSDAEHILFFCNNAGPAFIFGVLTNQIFENHIIGIALWAIHLVSSFFLGFLFRPVNVPIQPPIKYASAEDLSFLSACTTAVSKAGETALKVCVFVLAFSVITSYTEFFLPIPFRHTVWSLLLIGSLELAGGVHLLASANLSASITFVLSAALLGWGGLCVHCQTITALHQNGLSAKKYLIGKLLHGILSSALSCLLLPFLPLETACFSVASSTIPILPLLLPLFALLPKSSSGKISESHL